VKSFLCAVMCVGLACSARAQFPSSESATSSGEGAALLQSLLHVHRSDLLFRPDDLIAVEVYGVPDYKIQQRIAQDGTVQLPLVGKVKAAGTTVQQLETTLADNLSQNGIIRNPQVTVHAVERPWAVVTVSGAVEKPGVFPAYGDLDLIDYLSEAGGFIETFPTPTVTNSPASPVVTLVRPSLGNPVSIPLGSDPAHSPWARIPLFPGDVIHVAKMGVVYAFGALKNQGAYPLKNTAPTTVLQLVALAGGIGYEADRKDASIIRTRGNSRYVLDVDVAKILKGKMADVALQADDILFVPPNNLKAAIKGGGSGLLVSLASAYIYTHP
jgi:polysaccharide biosynthesis/export protein